jgi:hypothetical protein
MGKIIGTCGHEITDRWFDGRKGSIIIKDFTKTGKKSAAYLLVCEKCLSIYRTVILETEKDVKEWFKQE